MNEPQKPNKKGNGKKDPGPYSYEMVNKTKQKSFGLSMIMFFMFSAYIIAENNYYKRDWMEVAIPIVVVGLAIAFFPPIRYWVYKPWQSKARKYEQHYRD